MKILAESIQKKIWSIFVSLYPHGKVLTVVFSLNSNVLKYGFQLG
jgi:hypothetical protein